MHNRVASGLSVMHKDHRGKDTVYDEQMMCCVSSLVFLSCLDVWV